MIDDRTEVENRAEELFDNLTRDMRNCKAADYLLKEAMPSTSVMETIHKFERGAFFKNDREAARSLRKIRKVMYILRGAISVFVNDSGMGLYDFVVECEDLGKKAAENERT